MGKQICTFPPRVNNRLNTDTVKPRTAVYADNKLVGWYRVTRPIIGIGMRFRDFELIFRKIELTFKQSIYTQSLVLFPLDNFMSYI